MFLTGGKKAVGTSTQFEGNELHTNGGASQGARVIEDSTIFADFGTTGQFTNGQFHVLVNGAEAGKAAGRGDAVPTVTAVSTQNITSNVYQLGLRGDGDFPFYGEINEVIIFSNDWIDDAGGYEQYYQD